MTSDINSLIALITSSVSDLYAVSYFKSIILYCIALCIVFLTFKIIKKFRVGVFNEKII